MTDIAWVCLSFGGTYIALIVLYIWTTLNWSKEADKWTEERQILLNRIDNPKYRPPLTPSQKTQDLAKIKELREEQEQFGLVGQIVE
jgi:hypothetical protein